MKIRAFITHKKTEHFQDCQDRFCVNADTKSAAVSDGMSQSILGHLQIPVASLTKETAYSVEEKLRIVNSTQQSSEVFYFGIKGLSISIRLAVNKVI